MLDDFPPEVLGSWPRCIAGLGRSTLELCGEVAGATHRCVDQASIVSSRLASRLWNPALSEKLGWWTVYKPRFQRAREVRQAEVGALAPNPSDAAASTRTRIPFAAVPVKTVTLRCALARLQPFSCSQCARLR